MVLWSLQRWCYGHYRGVTGGVIVITEDVTEVVLLSVQRCDRWYYGHYRGVTGGVIVIREV